jgi:transcription initiation factor TFIIH subunit 3
LLTIVLDTNPHAWSLLNETLPLSKAVANLLVFINAHVSINSSNQVAVIASHSHRAAWLYPRTPKPILAGEDTEMTGTDGEANVAFGSNKYRSFAKIERDILDSLRELIDSTSAEDVSSSTTTAMAGALTLALSYINKAEVSYQELGMGPNTGKINENEHTEESSSGLLSRILIISVSGDLAHQYIPVMNTTFAAQTKRIPIDIMKLSGDTVFLQQAADATKGTYMQLRNPRGFLQYLMMAFLPDQAARQHLISPSQDVVDFRAACFCHRNVVDVGFVCSICLSIFCKPPEGAICLTCGTHLALGNYGAKPAVIPRKKKKKKRVGNGMETGSQAGTPAPGD